MSVFDHAPPPVMVDRLQGVPFHKQKDSPLAKKLSTFIKLSGRELIELNQVYDKPRSFIAGRDLVRQGKFNQKFYILSDGWVCSYKIQPDGSRQIFDIQVPGDFLGLRNVLQRSSDVSFEPIVDISVAEIQIDDLFFAFDAVPRLATAFMRAMSRDEAVVAEHLINIGRRNADERMAHFFLELGARLTLIGVANKSGFDCPMTQYHIADALGLSAVHVNRVLRNLREQGLFTFRNGYVAFNDYNRLSDLAGFDPSYLN